MDTLIIDRVGYLYPNLVLSINSQTFLFRVKDERGKKWLKWKNIESVYLYPTIENDWPSSSSPRPHHPPIKNIERLVIDLLNNFPTRMDNTNEYSRNFIWGWRKGTYEDKSGMLGPKTL